MPPTTVHRTCRISLRLTPAQRRRCYGQLRSAGDVWAMMVDCNRQLRAWHCPPVVNYQALCRELARFDQPFGELSSVGARSVLQRYSVAWFQAAKHRKAGAERPGFPRRKRGLFPVRFYHRTFTLQGRRVRLPVAKGRPPLWLRLARPIPYPQEQVRAVTLLVDGGRLVLDVTAAVPVEPAAVDAGRVAGVDLGIIHPYALVTGQGGGLVVSGRAVRAESYLHLADTKARSSKAGRRAPARGQRGSRRWRRYLRAQRVAEARHRRRVRQAHHQAARLVVGFAVQHRVETLLVGDPKGITGRQVGRVQNLRLRQWRRTHLVQALRDKAELAGIQVRLVDERGSSSTCPACRQRASKPKGRRFACPHCRFIGHRDVVGACNLAIVHGGGPVRLPGRIEHRRAGQVPVRRDRRRHLLDARRRSCLVSGRPPPGRDGRRSPARQPAASVEAVPLVHAGLASATGEDRVASPDRANVA